MKLVVVDANFVLVKKLVLSFVLFYQYPLRFAVQSYKIFNYFSSSLVKSEIYIDR